MILFNKLYLSDKSVTLLGSLEDSDWDTPRPLKDIHNMLVEIIKEEGYYHYQLYPDRHGRSSYIGIVIFSPERFAISYHGKLASKFISIDEMRKHIWGVIHYIQEGHYDASTD